MKEGIKFQISPKFQMVFIELGEGGGGELWERYGPFLQFGTIQILDGFP